jgi:hypothetical protein
VFSENATEKRAIVCGIEPIIVDIPTIMTPIK